MPKSKTYRCVVEIDVDADSPVAAARLAWRTLTAPEAQLPLVSTIPHDENGDIPSLADERKDVDLDKVGLGRRPQKRSRRRPNCD